MKKNVDISKNFWKEFYARGFSLAKETGGTYLPEHKGSLIKIMKDNIYHIVNPIKNTKVTVIEPGMFGRTVEKIENIVKYKLFY